MTYRQLLNDLRYLTQRQLDHDVTIYNKEQDEYLPATSCLEVTESDVLDPGHYVLVIN